MPLYSKITIIQQKLLTIQALQKEGWFPTYLDLYSYLIGFPLLNPCKHHSCDWPHQRIHTQKYRDAWQQFLVHINEVTRHALLDKRNHFFLHEDAHWTYIEVASDEQRIGLIELIKLYVPAAYADVPRLAHDIFDFLFKRQRQFSFKVAHQERYDTICLWILREELEEVVDFLCLLPLLPAPVFCPEYKNIGISRELETNFYEALASTLFMYLPTTQQPSLVDYIAFLECTWASTNKNSKDWYSDYDRMIILRSLKCMAYNTCPVMQPTYSILDIRPDS